MYNHTVILKYMELVMQRLRDLNKELYSPTSRVNIKDLESLILTNEKMLIALERAYHGNPVMLKKIEVQIIPIIYEKHLPHSISN